ncbi:MAG TPA: GTPase Era [Flavobacteriales bacterium]|nr:GTPase Era [Flavobacteriales bacterium]HRE73308.1 GTPase Era [Flavobacteriales bacterium]HRE98179.1 GTPase Era [Flavobacteriales bacterium]HRJ38364.1 GTPase Era [Flavobacteriales bacterium]
MAHKAGFVNIIGSPNVGKSTLMNALVGEKVSIINAKAQTTRHRIMGIASGEDFQIVYSDTPGVLKPAYKLQEGMMSFVNQAFQDADVFLFVTDIHEDKPQVPEVLERLKKQSVPVFVLVNKIDLSDQEKVGARLDYWKEQIPNAMVFGVSALHKYNLDVLFDKILEKLPESPAFFDKEEYTDKSLRFLVSEIIREKILRLYDKEIPYSCEVIVDSFKEEPEITRISAVIYVSRDSQKGIIIGHQGKMIKKLGTLARKEMEEMLNKKVFLELFVKVMKNWRDDERHLKNFGYTN